MRSLLSTLIGISACFMALNGSAYAQDQGADWAQIDEYLVGSRPSQKTCIDMAFLELIDGDP